MARKQFNQLKLTSKTCQNEVNLFCANIEEINNRMAYTLSQLNDKLPGLMLFSTNKVFISLFSGIIEKFPRGKTTPGSC
jgi:hypothetical protein